MSAICSMTELLEKSAVYSDALSRQTIRISVCAGTGCVANGSKLVYAALMEQAKLAGNTLVTIQMLTEDESLKGETIVKTGCRGFCAKGPLVHVDPLNVLYTYVKTDRCC